MNAIAMLGFQALWSPLFALFLFGILLMYYLLIGPLRGKFIESERVSKKQLFCFTIGIIFLYAVSGSPIDVIGHILFSVHMTEMAVMFLVVPPLLLLGLPAWLLQTIVSHKVVGNVLRILTKPLFALFLFNGLLSMYHLPFIFDVVKQSQLLHSISLVVLFFTSFMMWWPVLNPLPSFQSLSDLQKIGYMFANGLLLTPACALIIFASQPLYATYTNPQAFMRAMELCVPLGTLTSLGISGPSFFYGISPLEDQQAGGVIMKIMQEFVYIVVIGYVFSRWVKNEKKKEAEGFPTYVSENRGT
ncbi:cytochrome c oxidase assembly factor CtaG [Ectobacillus polymachus]|uniref:cytochrome c oxidase assembly factor CtaG n=1 Tax=Ectobacillus polymachus TaxID=1508806 RepID=UPI003A8850E5